MRRRCEQNELERVKIIDRRQKWMSQKLREIAVRYLHAALLLLK